jgi:hypothetical protein
MGRGGVGLGDVEWGGVGLGGVELGGVGWGGVGGGVVGEWWGGPNLHGRFVGHACKLAPTPNEPP